jgi:hypothetical protein
VQEWLLPEIQTESGYSRAKPRERGEGERRVS